MTLRGIAELFIAPVFFFLSLVLFLLTIAFLKSAYMTAPAFLVLACLVFVLAYNALMLGFKFRKA